MLPAQVIIYMLSLLKHFLNVALHIVVVEKSYQNLSQLFAKLLFEYKQGVKDKEGEPFSFDKFTLEFQLLFFTYLNLSAITLRRYSFLSLLYSQNMAPAK